MYELNEITQKQIRKVEIDLMNTPTKETCKVCQCEGKPVSITNRVVELCEKHLALWWQDYSNMKGW